MNEKALTVYEVKRKYNIMKRIFEHKDALVKEGYNVIYIALQGSQNYNLDIETSDIDTKAIVLPSLEMIARGETKISFTYKMENGEQIDVKDPKTMFNQFLKQNITYLEILFTEFYWCHPRAAYLIESELRAKAEDIGNINPRLMIDVLRGMAKEKRGKVSKVTDVTKDIIDKYGYNGKEASHLARLRYFITYKYMFNYSLKRCYDVNNYRIASNKEEILNLKKQTTDKVQVEEDCDFYLQRIDCILNDAKEITEIGANQEEISRLDDVLVMIYYRYFREM